MTSDLSAFGTFPGTRYEEAFVWIWLPDANAPVVAGRLSRRGAQLVFNYGRSYLTRTDAIPIYPPELPLQPGVIPLLPGLSMPNCIRDASPDAWGRRVLINRKLGMKGDEAATVELDELTYLLESGSDRIGSLDFQTSPETYTPRQSASATLTELQQAADRVEQGVPLSAELDAAFHHGTSLGGARPKAMIIDGDARLIAKFSASRDLYNVVKAEFIAMRLAALVGLDVAPVRLTSALGKDVLLITRFDRTPHAAGWRRRAMVSALTILELDEMMASYASYDHLAEIVRRRFTAPKETARELFSRIVFNILCGNTDDHARNHAAFWDGASLTLTPAYDICPQARSGNEASQAMLIRNDDRRSQLFVPVEAAPQFLLSRPQAISIINNQVNIITAAWDKVCDEAALSAVDRAFLWRRQFLNPFAFYGAPEGVHRPA
jgi:serine/threonine-protein kinase HipA